LVPAYVGYLGGHAVGGPRKRRTFVERFTTFLHALAFVIGFSIVLVPLGALAGGVGFLLVPDWVRWMGGLVMIFFGLILTGLIKLPFLYAERRVRMRHRPRWGYLSSLLVGVSFVAGWTPCFGPTLAAILALSASQETVGRSVVLLAAYSAGLGIPFLVVGLAVDRVGAFLRRLGRYLHAIQVATGVLLVVFGILLLTGWLPVLGAWMTRLGMGWDVGL
jgi:cytochrome c-type biogenesis protein